VQELLSTAQMRQADALAIESGVPGIELMEAAGRAVAEAAAGLAPDGPVVVVAGIGNNGGDGYVAARLLRASGREVEVRLCGDPGRIRGDAALARDRWQGPESTEAPEIGAAALVIDALFGAGLDRAVSGRPAEMVEAINRAPARVIAVDVPSGLDGDSGRVMGVAVQADATVTFFRKKPGHLLEPGRSLCGRLVLAQIGIPAAVLGTIAPRDFENVPQAWRASLPVPGRAGHKYDRGHAVVVSGPMTRTGAARLAAVAALRAGAGLVTLASPGDALAVNAAHLTAVMLRRADDAAALGALLEDARFTALGIGPGLGAGGGQRQMIRAALNAGPALVLDADALTAFAAEPGTLFDAIGAREAPVILTPHAGEFARLFPDIAASGRAKPDLAREAAARSRATLLLKGADTVIAAPDGRTAINANAPPWLATAGSGDVLTGIATGLTAQGMPGFEAACAAVWLHGAAGSEAGPGLIAEDLAPALRPVLRGLLADPPSPGASLSPPI
jgi:ADP-dependent NAD(P)H-hydrate dehydratase / NAD(P)H-hydrate epimerase